MRRALTLVETLGAIALLGLMTVVSSEWIAMAMRLSSDASKSVVWEQAAHRTLDLIARDLRVGDDTEQPKARIDGDKLVIRTRAGQEQSSPGGPIDRTYSLRGTLLLCSQDKAASGAPRADRSRDGRTLIGELTEFGILMAEDEKGLVLVVTLATSHRVMAREFRL